MSPANGEKMKKEKMPNENLHVLKQELITITEELEELRGTLKDIEDLKLDIKGLKLFLGRVHPDFKQQFPDIMKKIVKT